MAKKMFETNLQFNCLYLVKLNKFTVERNEIHCVSDKHEYQFSRIDDLKNKLDFNDVVLCFNEHIRFDPNSDIYVKIYNMTQNYFSYCNEISIENNINKKNLIKL